MAFTANNFEKETTEGDTASQLVYEWITNLLTNIELSLDDEQKREILKGAAIVYYNQLKMDELL